MNESVELVRRAGLERAVAFTNAVMRRLVAELPALLCGSTRVHPDEAALKHSYRTGWPRHGGASSAPTRAARSCAPRTSRRSAACASIAARSPTSTTTPVAAIQISPRHIVERIPDDWLGKASPGRRAEGRSSRASRSERRTASATSTSALPGGKATQLLGDVVAVERHEGRARELTETTLRLGAENVRVVCANGLALPPDLDGFDQARRRALLRARDPRLPPRSALASRGALPELQLALLRAATERVRPGGTITYAVCTMSREENEDVVDALGLEPDDLGADWRFRHPSRPEFLLTLPHRHGTSGFFVARVRRPYD